jgi:hypothetical protein
MHPYFSDEDVARVSGEVTRFFHTVTGDEAKRWLQGKW